MSFEGKVAGKLSPRRASNRIMRALFLLLIAGFSVAAQTRTVTNADLEKYRLERLKADEAYRKNYARLGMPSPDEIDRINAQRRRELSALAERLEAQRDSVEAAIIGRADELRSQIGSISSQIEYLRRLRGRTFPQPLTFWSYGYRPIYRAPAPVPQVPPNLQRINDISGMYPTSTDIFNRSIGHYPNPGRWPRPAGGFVFPVFVTVSGSNEVESRLIYLESVKAGLMNEWRALEEAARRAGVRID